MSSVKTGYDQAVVMAAPRSGTRYMAYLLRECGLDASHELTIEHKRAYEVTVNYKAHMEVARDLIKPNTILFHQVRDPLKQMSSWWSVLQDEHLRYPDKPIKEYCGGNGNVARFCQKYIWDDPTCSMAHWYFWNKEIEHTIQDLPFCIRYNVEDVGVPVIELFFDCLGKKLDIEKCKEALKRQRKDEHNLEEVFKFNGVHSRGKRIDLTWADFNESELRDNVMSMADTYGYDT